MFICFLLASVLAQDFESSMDDASSAFTDPTASLVCTAANAVAATFCQTIDDWSNLNDVTVKCMHAEFSINAMLGFHSHDHIEHICNTPDQLEAICQSVENDDDITTCEISVALELENAARPHRRELGHQRVSCFDEMTVVQTRQGEKYMRDVIAGEELLTCEAGVYTRVFASVDHQDSEKVSLLRLETNTSYLAVTASHFVLSNDEYVRAGDMKVGMDMDGAAITSISSAIGRRRNVVTLRQDIMVNGMCGTWVDSSFASILYMAPLNARMNPIAASYPQFVFSATQKIADTVVPLLDAGVVSYSLATHIMIFASLMIAAANASFAMGTCWFFYGHMKL